MANSLVVHIMLNEGSEVPKASIQLEFIGASSNTGHSALLLAISSLSKLGILYHFFYGLLVLQGIFYQNFNFFLNRLDRSPKLQFNWSSQEQVRIRGTPPCFQPYLPHPNSESHTVIFINFLFFKEYSFKISIFLSTGSISPQSFNSVGVHKSKFEYGALRLIFSHISLIQTWNRVPFFLWTPSSLRDILPKFQIFSQLVITTEKCYFVDLIIRVLSTFEQ